MRILIADRDPTHAQALGRRIRRLGHEALLARGFESILDVAQARGPDVVLADVAIAPGGGEQILGALQAALFDLDVVLTADVATVELATSAMRDGAVDLLPRDIDDVALALALCRLERNRMLHDQQHERAVEQLRVGMTREHMVAFMIGLANVIDAKSPYTREHSDRVAHRTKVFCRYLNLPDDEVEAIAFGAKLHDIGKVGVPDAILNSTGKLSPEEREVMQRHPVDGAAMLRPVVVLAEIIPMVERHHECWDGTGYPDGLRGEEIPFGARIVKLIDYYDAITSVRPYRQPMSQEAALQVLRSEAGRQLDPTLTEQFVNLVDSGLLSDTSVSAVIPSEYRLAVR